MTLLKPPYTTEEIAMCNGDVTLFQALHSYGCKRMLRKLLLYYEWQASHGETDAVRTNYLRSACLILADFIDRI